MKRNYFAFLVTVFLITLFSSYPQKRATANFPAEATTFKDCLCGGTWVIRCDYGGGDCNPSQQYFCDEVC
jgi:hypothetical protein